MDWEPIAIAGAVVLAAVVLARIVDRRMAKRTLDPVVATRYRVLRRTVTTVIVSVGVLSALLTIPSVRAVAGGVIASTAILGLILGLAAQKTLSNFVAGILIAVAQPFRLGDLITVGDQSGRVEEIGLTYTFIKTPDNARLVIPNEKLASDTIRNSTIVTREKLAQVTVQVPLDKDLDAVVDLLRSETAGDPRGEVLVTELNGSAGVTVRSWAPEATELERVESDLRLRVARLLREQSLL